MSKVGEEVLKEEIIANRFVNCNAVESVKYIGPPGPWFCPQIGLLTPLEQFSHLQKKRDVVISSVAGQSTFQRK